MSPNPTSMSYSSEHAATKTASEDGEDAGFLNNFTKLFNRGTTKHATLVFPLSTPLLPPKTLGPKIMEISAPTGFKHEVHVGFDKESGDFTGLPNEWKNLLDSSGISREEQANNPQVKKRLKHPHLDGELIRNFFFFMQAVLDALDFFTKDKQEAIYYKFGPPALTSMKKPAGAPSASSPSPASSPVPTPAAGPVCLCFFPFPSSLSIYEQSRPAPGPPPPAKKDDVESHAEPKKGIFFFRLLFCNNAHPFLTL